MLLFNLNDDVGETKDLAAAEPEKAQELYRRMMDYLQAVDSDVLTLYKK
jgi:hypothetical protein